MNAPIEVIERLACNIKTSQGVHWYPGQNVYRIILFPKWSNKREDIDTEYLWMFFQKICEEYGSNSLHNWNIVFFALEAALIGNSGAHLLKVVHVKMNLNTRFENSKHSLPLLKEGKWSGTRISRRTRASA